MIIAKKERKIKTKKCKIFINTMHTGKIMNAPKVSASS